MNPRECPECEETVMPVGEDAHCPLCGTRFRTGLTATRVEYVREESAGSLPDASSWDLFSDNVHIDTTTTGTTTWTFTFPDE